MQTIRERGTIALICGVPSHHDMIASRLQGLISLPAGMPNELIGQEGGRFDSLYLEDA